MVGNQKFTEAKLEQAITELLEGQDYTYTRGTDPNDVRLKTSPKSEELIA